jgi:hypothetical protein
MVNTENMKKLEILKRIFPPLMLMSHTNTKRRRRRTKRESLGQKK